MKQVLFISCEPQLVESLEHEIILYEKLPYHKNIVRYLFHEKTDRELRMFMTRYNCNLRQCLIERKEEIKSKTADYYYAFEVRNFALEIIKGLEYLHSNSILHRDLKSDNVFVIFDERHEISTLSIGDFDTAKHITRKGSGLSVIGTPRFMAPEVFLSKGKVGNYTFKADVFSWGMLLYELITLMRPYEEKSTNQVPDIIMAGLKPDINTNLYTLSGYAALIKLHHNCIALQPENRPEVLTIREFLESMSPM